MPYGVCYGAASGWQANNGAPAEVVNMNLNHLHLPVTDAPAAAEFLQRYFGMKRLQGGNKNFIALQDGAGMVLIVSKHKASAFPPGFHIGFIQESEERVNEINERMRADGIEVDAPERHHAWTFYVQAPGGLTVEVLA